MCSKSLVADFGEKTSINSIYSKESVIFGLNINSFFDEFVPVIKIAALFVQLSLYQRIKIILEILNEYISVGKSNKIEFIQDYF